MQDGIVLILCKMEKIFLSAFFDVMIHLALHLPGEAELDGPVQTLWIYPFERELANIRSGRVTKYAQRGVLPSVT
jgi:hypothetical protein